MSGCWVRILCLLSLQNYACFWLYIKIYGIKLFVHSVLNIFPVEYAGPLMSILTESWPDLYGALLVKIFCHCLPIELMGLVCDFESLMWRERWAKRFVQREAYFGFLAGVHKLFRSQRELTVASNYRCIFFLTIFNVMNKCSFWIRLTLFS